MLCFFFCFFQGLVEQIRLAEDELRHESRKYDILQKILKREEDEEEEEEDDDKMKEASVQSLEREEKQAKDGTEDRGIAAEAGKCETCYRHRLRFTNHFSSKFVTWASHIHSSGGEETTGKISGDNSISSSSQEGAAESMDV